MGASSIKTRPFPFIISARHKSRKLGFTAYCYRTQRHILFFMHNFAAVFFKDNIINNLFISNSEFCKKYNVNIDEVLI